MHGTVRTTRACWTIVAIVCCLAILARSGEPGARQAMCADGLASRTSQCPRLLPACPCILPRRVQLLQEPRACDCSSPCTCRRQGPGLEAHAYAHAYAPHAHTYTYHVYGYSHRISQQLCLMRVIRLVRACTLTHLNTRPPRIPAQVYVCTSVCLHAHQRCSHTPTCTNVEAGCASAALLPRVVQGPLIDGTGRRTCKPSCR